ncbi:RagB/SusD family nutrient uptake outer membrane protein [Hymenobacter crusticola]|uniref:RagB/SusD family nutrient uptake outer membrane protein n=1 Tax=Hymenobacter crusticola TaxID=1770526 RepID=A0A243WIT7_9BACT|nr:RagB/SusD family nutrient uptake outer membrane protein [Hymenobacter crusticola]OUJ75805.1 RagB/SusD family nutrient uptake outer membrane protein [Hymenobacter crusticola]
MKITAKSLRVSLLAATTLGLFNACTKLDDESYNQIVTSQFTPTSQDLQALIGPAYSTWRPLFLEFNGVYRINETSTDETVTPGRPNGWVDDGSYRRLHEHKWTALDATPRDAWTQSFAGITNCNRVLYQIESGQVPVPTGKEQLVAELRVLRASYYYMLCDLFGNVPIVDRFDVPAGFLPEQNTRKQVYDFVVKEVTESLPLLGDVADATTYGRFSNKWAAQALLAKVYLNAQVYTGQAEWVKCIAACDAVINSGKYSLEPIQANVFKTQNEGSKEIIFAIPFDEVYATGFRIHMQTLQPQNQQTYNAQGSMWGGGICAIPQFISTYDPDDNRLKQNWIQGQQYSSSGTPLVGVFGVTTGKPLVFTNTLPGIESSLETDGLRVGKFEFKQGVRIDLSNDFPLFRYADILMMKAESQLRLGQSGPAATLVTQVRQRNFITNPAKATVTAADLLKGSTYQYGPARNNVVSPVEGGADIQYGRFLDELGWEFTAEGHRRQDMIRFGVYTKKSWLSHVPNGDYRTLMPIPQNVLNTNANLKQNPGY